jgi:hypothetical protein
MASITGSHSLNKEKLLSRNRKPQQCRYSAEPFQPLPGLELCREDHDFATRVLYAAH